ncbi:gephyrin-like [Stegodyphus dumicola]|uniref:gephyrin-like n=1 Tax=Stegodyphus dumicola TaxID=202533 RepID=UPI0015B24988|nr:gephyrin-like [Stegodyphus dumicola]
MGTPYRIPDYSVGILVVSDTVYRGEKTDLSGVNLEQLLKSQQLFHVASVLQHCVPDSIPEIQSVLKQWSDEKHIDLIFTVGGTGFSPRDVTPEATKGVIEREAPHLSSHMILGCCQKSKFAVLSRSVSGMRGQTLIVNLPGSIKASRECLEMIASILPHAVDQLKSENEKVAADHKIIQGSFAGSK